MVVVDWRAREPTGTEQKEHSPALRCQGFRPFFSRDHAARASIRGDHWALGLAESIEAFGGSIYLSVSISKGQFNVQRGDAINKLRMRIRLF